MDMVIRTGIILAVCITELARALLYGPRPVFITRSTWLYGVETPVYLTVQEFYEKFVDFFLLFVSSVFLQFMYDKFFDYSSTSLSAKLNSMKKIKSVLA